MKYLQDIRISNRFYKGSESSTCEKPENHKTQTSTNVLIKNILKNNWTDKLKNDEDVREEINLGRILTRMRNKISGLYIFYPPLHLYRYRGDCQTVSLHETPGFMSDTWPILLLG